VCWRLADGSADAREQGKGLSDGPLAAGALRLGGGRHPARRAPCAAAHDQGLPGKRQLLMPERQQNFWKKIASILRH
jgi:hypothetical protein